MVLGDQVEPDAVTEALMRLKLLMVGLNSAHRSIAECMMPPRN